MRRGSAGYDLSGIGAGNTAGPLALSTAGRLAVLAAARPTGYQAVWSFDPPPVVNALLCEQASFMPGIASFTGLDLLSLNASSNFVQRNTWYPGSGVAQDGIYQGTCAVLGAVLSNGDLAPAVDGIPGTANITNIGFNLPPDPNASNAVAFTSWLVNGGVTSANDEVQWLHDAAGFHAVLREGGTAPELAGGETLEPNAEGGYSISDQPPLLSDVGSVAFDAKVQPANTGAVMLYRTDRTLHVLARDGASVPGLFQRLFIINFNQRSGSGIAMNRFGQVLLQATTRDSLDPFSTSKLRLMGFATDASGKLVPIVVDQASYTVRTGQTGIIALNAALTDPLPSNATDGRRRNFSNKGEYVFLANFTPSGGSALAGVFAAGGPDLSTVAVSPEPGAGFALAPPAPNPSEGGAQLAFTLARRGQTRLEVFDLAGRHVRTLLDATLDAGPHFARWSGNDDVGRRVGSGVYFVRLAAPGAAATRRMVLLR